MVNCHFNWLGSGTLKRLPTLVSLHPINPHAFKSGVNCLVSLNESFVRLFLLCTSCFLSILSS